MELLMDIEKVLSVAKVDLVPMRRTSVLSLLNLRKLSENHPVSSWTELCVAERKYV